MALAADYNPPIAPEAAPGEVAVHGTPVSLSLVAATMLLVGLWAAIVPFAGPGFGYSVDGRAAWTWTMHQAVLGLVPGAVAVVAALMIFGRLPLLRREMGTAGIGLAGLLAILAGGWLVVGPAASAAVLGSRYFVPATPFRSIVDQLGTSLGPGLVIVACGAFAAGWSFRQRAVFARLAVVTPMVPAASAVPVVPTSAVPVAPVAAPAAPAVPVVTEPVSTVPPDSQTWT